MPPLRVRQFAERALAEVPTLAEDILGEIQREYPQLPLVLGDNGEPLALLGIRRALEHFVEHLDKGLDTPRVPSQVFQGFGRGEVLQGRSLDSLQAIYRMGIRMSWRRLAAIGIQMEIPAPAMYELADVGFEFLDGLVAESVRGYAEAAARRAGERLRLQRRLLELMLSEPQRSAAEVAELLADRAARIGWTVPHTVQVAVLLRPARSAVAPAVGDEVLLDMECDQPRMVIPDPDTAGRAELVRRATAGWSGAIGPQVPVAGAVKSLHWAQNAVGMMERGLLPSGELLHCTEHTEALVLLPPEELISDLARRRLAPLDSCGPGHRIRLAETLLAWLETRGGAPEVARRLGVHPQTVRYRLRQIRELWGREIDDPDSRFELELALRSMRLRGEFGGGARHTSGPP
ncbi:helix-turn-helix domain-containing protein [Streptomyces oceani]|uniref:PucR family transcriptional regulator n=1 Tax=Streptomyces oceani TaxID=1075402 RepID=UPI001FCCF62F|nr:PucR family transcriptional regulator [Streptomyces oceani]